MAATHGSPDDYGASKTELEVVVTKTLSALVALALVAALFVGAGLTARSGQGNTVSNVQGLMPEVVVAAEMPRLEMPTIEVHGYRSVAMSGSDLRVN